MQLLRSNYQGTDPAEAASTPWLVLTADGTWDEVRAFSVHLEEGGTLVLRGQATDYHGVAAVYGPTGWREVKRG